MKPQEDPRRPLRRHIELVVIGTSAGGVEALLARLARLPACWRLPVVVVVHLPETHESRLAQVFGERLPSLSVREAQDKMPIEDGTLYFAPPGYHLSVERERCFSLSCEPPLNFSRPSIDVLMYSAADVYGPLLAGLLLTGANQDGAEGLRAIHAAGGLTAVQDPALAHAPAMPQAAIAAHKPDFIRPLGELRELLLELDADHAHGC